MSDNPFKEDENPQNTENRKQPTWWNWVLSTIKVTKVSKRKQASYGRSSCKNVENAKGGTEITKSKGYYWLMNSHQ